MGTSNLNATELASIQHALAVHSMTRGSYILGSELGGLLNSALRPKTVRDFGGLRRFVQTELSNAIRLEGTHSNSPDLVFAILGPNDKSSVTVPLTGIREVAGQDLWKLFSNPNIASELVVRSSGSVFTVPFGESTPDGYTLLARPDREDYRNHARQFAELQEQPEARTALINTLVGEDFYKKFISELRALQTPTESVLKKWEVSRAEFVAKKLIESLTQCGVTSAKSMEIVALARPIVVPHRPKTIEPATRSNASYRMPPQGNQAASLQSILHHAIELMSESDLRELRVPFGILLEALSRAQR